MIISAEKQLAPPCYRYNRNNKTFLSFRIRDVLPVISDNNRSVHGASVITSRAQRVVICLFHSNIYRPVVHISSIYIYIVSELMP